MTDERARYRAAENEVFAHYHAGRYAEGAALARVAMADFPDRRADLAHAAACLLTLDGRPAEAFAELTAAFEAGAWWRRRILVEDDDLAAVRTMDGFDALVEAAHARALAAGDRAESPVLRRSAGPPVGLLVALHGAGEDAVDAAAAWGPAVDAGWVVLAPVSSQRQTPSYRTWPNHAAGVRDVEAALATLDPGERALPLVAAGFSAGGRQAIRWALSVPAAAFVVMAPAIGPDDLDREAVAAAARRGLRGHVLLGDDDHGVRDGALAAVDRLREWGVECGLDLLPGLGHGFPDGFAHRLPPVLATVAGQDVRPS